MRQMKKPKLRMDPAPSRWSYRYQRLMLTPLFRKMLFVGLPLGISLGLAAAYLAQPERREAIAQAYTDMREQIETRPEFMVNLLAVEGASTEIEEDIREIFPYDLPASSFDIDLEAVREIIVGLPAVADANVRVRQGGVMVAEVSEREPVVIWRSRDGLGLVDAEGILVSEIDHRAARADLPVIAGEGADRVVPQALALFQAARPLGHRLRGLVRMGERRWDVVLDGGQRILLPEVGAVRALERVIVLDDVQDMLSRDLVAVDMRLAARPTIRMNTHATEDWWQAKSLNLGTNAE